MKRWSAFNRQKHYSIVLVHHHTSLFGPSPLWIARMPPAGTRVCGSFAGYTHDAPMNWPPPELSGSCRQTSMPWVGS